MITDTEKAQEVLNLIKHLFRGSCVESNAPGYYIFSWADNHCEVGPSGMKLSAKAIASQVSHAFIDLEFTNY